MAEQKFTGKISYLSDKGFGFVESVGSDGLTKRLFFHASACKGVDFSQLYLEEEVIFSKVEENEKGFATKHVELK